ncbi:YhcG family protein [Sulfuricurvum sp.]|uniref:PDDEXK nuclease domain-containing protein n=1 Tax=Sulfuricurvum sp. TaxID=2025608 RepID=UPI00356681C4
MQDDTFEHLITQITTVHTTIQTEAIRSISKSLTIRNWLIGYYIVEYEQNGSDRANYGDKIIQNLVTKLSHIKGMSRSNLKSFRLFYITYPQISQSVPDQFSLDYTKSQSVTGQSTIHQIDIFKLLNSCTFTHFVELIKIDDSLKRLFYEVETIKGNWSVRELQRQVNSQTYERIGLSHDKKELIASITFTAEKLLPEQIIKDPYILEFTGLETKAKYSENDLETALLNHLQDFLLELGNGFCFEARQKRISIDNEHDRIDLVFYHRVLKCHILVDLKIREFSHADVGQMNFYLNYYKNEIIAESDNLPIGLILCTTKNHTKVEYATAGLSNQLFVSKYKINLPSLESIEEFIEDELSELQKDIKGIEQ